MRNNCLCFCSSIFTHGLCFRLVNVDLGGKNIKTSSWIEKG